MINGCSYVRFLEVATDDRLAVLYQVKVSG